MPKLGRFRHGWWAALLLAGGCNPNLKPTPADQLAAHAHLVVIAIIIVVAVDALVLWATAQRHGGRQS